MKRRPSRAVFRHPELDELLKRLDPNHKLRRMVEDMETVLKEHMYAGHKVPKKKTPKYFIDKYSLPPRSPNLFVYDNPEWFRSCYIIADPEGIGDGCPVILEIMDHDEYNKKFGYKKK